MLRRLKRIGTKLSFQRPTDFHGNHLCVLILADAFRSEAYGQLAILIGLLAGDLRHDKIYSAVSWLSHKSKHSVKTVPAAQITAAFEGTQPGKKVAACYRGLLNAEVRVHLALDSKKPFLLYPPNPTLSTGLSEVTLVQFD